jgi:Ni/Co efflux regulator RcnB
MKRLMSALIALTMVAAPVAAAAQDRDRGRDRRAERQYDRRYDNGGRRGYGVPVPVAPNPGAGGAWGNRAPAPAPREFSGRVTADRFSYQGGYARPPAPQIRPWGRGQYLPQEYWGARVPDPGRYRLRPPPYGYSWVGVGRDVYLMQDTTGLILDSIPGAF